ncbi:hypothetical protein BaRGS_00022677, partial [Batillaria attramentaria]
KPETPIKLIRADLAQSPGNSILSWFLKRYLESGMDPKRFDLILLILTVERFLERLSCPLAVTLLLQCLFPEQVLSMLPEPLTTHNQLGLSDTESCLSKRESCLFIDDGSGNLARLSQGEGTPVIWLDKGRPLASWLDCHKGRTLRQTVTIGGDFGNQEEDTPSRSQNC